MATSIVYGALTCCAKGDFSRSGKILKSQGKVKVGAAFAVDLILVISSVVVGVLGLFSILPMPQIASYALFGFGGAVVLADIISNVLVSIHEKKQRSKEEGFHLLSDAELGIDTIDL